jgi:hypothetical protein
MYGSTRKNTELNHGRRVPKEARGSIHIQRLSDFYSASTCTHIAFILNTLIDTGSASLSQRALLCRCAARIYSRYHDSVWGIIEELAEIEDVEVRVAGRRPGKDVVLTRLCPVLLRDTHIFDMNTYMHTCIYTCMHACMHACIHT